MKQKIQNILCVVGAVCIAFLSYTIYQQHTAIPIFVPEISAEELDAREAAAQQDAARAAAATRARKLVACSTDDDCVIVDKDPCGCLSGPKGVIAINVEQMESFSNRNSALTTACPDREPSTEGPCSPQARPVCRERMCTIVY